MTAALGRPRSPISLMRREHKDLLDRLASNSRTQVRCCAVAMISYLKHWHEWKEAHYPTRWIYQPLRVIREDLMEAYTLHVIRAALDLLEKLGFLSIRKNDRRENRRNGQDKTHQYLLHVDRIEEALEKLFAPKKAKTSKNSPVDKAETSDINSETPGINLETSRFTGETHTQIPYTDSCSDSCSLLEEREKLESQPGVEEVEVSQSNSTCEEVPKDLKKDWDEKPNLGTDEFSAAPALKCVKLAQDDMKPLPKLKSDSEALLRSPYSPSGILRQALPKASADRSSGFRTEEERDGFYQALLELGKSQGKKSPVAWASAIIKSIHKGNPCQYLIEYREGQRVGICEKQEWEIAPGQPYEQFVTYLKTRSKKTGMTDEEAIALSHRQLQDVNLAKSLWESCKRYIAKCSEDWEKQKQLGVQNAYLPPELLPERQVSLDEVGSAIALLQSGCVQLQAVESVELTSVTADALEPAKELPSEPVIAEQLESVAADQDQEPAIAEQPERVSAAELQQKLNLPISASLVRLMVKNNPQWGYRIEDDLVLPAVGAPSLEHLRSLLDSKITASRVRRLIDRNPEWGLVVDEDGHLWEF